MTLRSLLWGGLLLISTFAVNVRAEVWGHKLAQAQRLQSQAAAIESNRHYPAENRSKDDYQFLTKETYRK
jgi:hypothetical protein